jgi:hypothetical protein
VFETLKRHFARSSFDSLLDEDLSYFPKDDFYSSPIQKWIDLALAHGVILVSFHISSSSLLSLLFLFLKFYFLYFLYYICDVPPSPISQKSLKFGGTPTRPPCVSPRTRVPPSRSLGGTLDILHFLEYSRSHYFVVILLPFSIAFPYFTFWHLETQAKYFAWDRLVVVLSLTFVGCFYFIWKIFCKFIEHFHLLVYLVARVCKIYKLPRVLEVDFRSGNPLFKLFQASITFCFYFQPHTYQFFCFLLSKICNLIFTFMFRFCILKFLNIMFS